jgi:hypothetical protein
MEIKVSYYTLITDKAMGDGTSVPQGQQLILIRRDESDNLFFFETNNDIHKKLFWAKEDEVKHSGDFVEIWDEEKIIQRNRYVNGDLL